MIKSNSANTLTTAAPDSKGSSIVTNITRPRLWEFTIHFRRAETRPAIASDRQKGVTYYDGSYGFDWLRDEYVYDIEQVHELGIDPLTNNSKVAKLFRGAVNDLIIEYTRLNKSSADIAETQQIKNTLGEPYIPAWLAVYPTTHPSQKNGAGVDLYLQVEQEKSLNSATTPIKPIPDPASIRLTFDSDDGIEVTASGITTLADLMSVDVPETDLPFTGTELKSKVVKRHKDVSKAINIKATTASHNMRLVRIRATDTLDNSSRLVGILCVYPNAEIKKADISVVHCLTLRSPDPSSPETLQIKNISYKVTLPDGRTGTVHDTKTIIPSKWASSAPKQAEITLELERQSFNQALIETSLSFDYIDLTAHASARTQQFLTRFHSKTSVTTDTHSNTHFAPMMKELADIYYEELLQRSNIESQDNNTTYLFLTEYSVQPPGTSDSIGGSAWKEKCSGAQCDSRFRGGNFAIVFDTGSPKINILVHELGHSFSLPHTFLEPNVSRESHVHYFYMGYTDNIMDYGAKSPPPPNSTLAVQASLKNSNTLNATFKWQWDILRNDHTVT